MQRKSKINLVDKNKQCFRNYFLSRSEDKSGINTDKNCSKLTYYQVFILPITCKKHLNIWIWDVLS